MFLESELLSVTSVSWYLKGFGLYKTTTAFCRKELPLKAISKKKEHSLKSVTNTKPQQTF